MKRNKSKTGKRSGFEDRVAAALPARFAYESLKLPYTIEHNYIPDWVDTEAKLIIEAKGAFPSNERTRMKAIRKAHPEYRIVMVFQRPNNKISKASNTTYADWCSKNGIEWMTLDQLKEHKEIQK